MKILLRPICWVKTLWRTIETTDWRQFPYCDMTEVDGCDYVEQENGELICEICGKKDY